MKKARMNISHSRFTLFKLKIFGEIVTTKILCVYWLGKWPEKLGKTSKAAKVVNCEVVMERFWVVLDER